MCNALEAGMRGALGGACATGALSLCSGASPKGTMALGAEGTDCDGAVGPDFLTTVAGPLHFPDRSSDGGVVGSGDERLVVSEAGDVQELPERRRNADGTAVANTAADADGSRHVNKLPVVFLTSRAGFAVEMLPNV